MVSREEPPPLHRVSSTAVAQHPLLATVRRRRPDIDLILLPPEPPSGAVGLPVVDEDEARGEAHRLTAAWRLLGELIHAAGESAHPSVGWRAQSGLYALVIQKAVRSIGQDAGTELLRAAAARLAESDWRFSAGRRRGMPVLRAVDAVADPHLLLHAEAGPGATVLTLRTRPLNVADDVRSLIAKEVRTWQ